MAKYPDEGTFGDSIGESLDRAGLKDTGYHDKLGTPSGNQGVTPAGISGYIFNKLPPGDNIGDQDVAYVEEVEMRLAKVKEITGRGYPGDGWD